MDESSGKKVETVHQMKMRHKEELKALSKCAGKGKGAAKESKDRTTALEAQHAQELAEVKARLANAVAGADEGDERKEESTKGEKKMEVAGGATGEIKEEVEGEARAAADALGTIKLGGGIIQAFPQKLSKAQKKKQLKQGKEEDLERLAKEAEKDIKDVKKEEMSILGGQLSKLELCMKDIKADGNCLYRAVGHQLTLLGSGGIRLSDDVPIFLSLRRLAGAHIQANKDNFAPFLTTDDGDPLGDDDFDAYCAKVSTDGEPVHWGGHPEVTALAAILNREIYVHAADAPPVHAGPASSKLAPLHLSYHKHYYGLGAHYNSCVSSKHEDEADDE